MKVLVLLAAIYGVLFHRSYCGTIFVGPYDKTWASQCGSIKQYAVQTLQQCECLCTKSSTCNVISYKANTWCVLRGCTQHPIPKPTSFSPSGFQGYKIGRDSSSKTKITCCNNGEDCVKLGDSCTKPCQCKCNLCCKDPTTTEEFVSYVCRSIDLLGGGCTSPEVISGGQSQGGKGDPNGGNATIPTSMQITESQTQEGEFPWTVAVLSYDTTFVAGGSLVHRRVILTAAHKVHGKVPVDLVALIGYWDLKKEDAGSQNIGLEFFFLHPNFDSFSLKYNVALLILKKDVVIYNKFPMTISLATPDQLFDGSTCFISGWGKDVFEEQGENRRIMKKTPISIVSHDQCQTALRSSRLGPSFILDNSFVCAGGQGEDACATDGGSPLVCPDPSQPDRYVQVGVSSWSIGCNTVRSPAVFGSIPNSVDWINEIIG